MLDVGVVVNIVVWGELLTFVFNFLFFFLFIFFSVSISHFPDDSEIVLVVMTATNSAQKLYLSSV